MRCLPWFSTTRKVLFSLTVQAEQKGVAVADDEPPWVRAGLTVLVLGKSNGVRTRLVLALAQIRRPNAQVEPFPGLLDCLAHLSETNFVPRGSLVAPPHCGSSFPMGPFENPSRVRAGCGNRTSARRSRPRHAERWQGKRHVAQLAPSVPVRVATQAAREGDEDAAQAGEARIEELGCTRRLKPPSSLRKRVPSVGPHILQRTRGGLSATRPASGPPDPGAAWPTQTNGASVPTGVNP
jgi:hypothetical protein